MSKTIDTNAALLRAIGRRHVDIKFVESLLNRDELKAVNENGYNPLLSEPLLSAVYAGNTALAELLMSYGADVNALGPRGRKPLDCAPDAMMSATLLHHGADHNTNENKANSDAAKAYLNLINERRAGIIDAISEKRWRDLYNMLNADQHRFSGRLYNYFSRDFAIALFKVMLPEDNEYSNEIRNQLRDRYENDTEEFKSKFSEIDVQLAGLITQEKAKEPNWYISKESRPWFSF
jgi:hypothetical protein